MQRSSRIDTIARDDLEALDHEHVRLEQFLRDLCDTCTEFLSGSGCQGCDQVTQACCQGRLVSFYYDFLDLVSEHIENEESIIARYLAHPEDSRFFREHQQAHAAVIQELRLLMEQSIALSRQGETADAIRRLHEQISAMFGEHASQFDSYYHKHA
jgi:hypothetical protein